MDNVDGLQIDPNVSCDFEVFGKVQGCSFTKSCKTICTESGLCGWVKNTKNGTVAGKLQGKKSKVEHVVQWLTHTGSPGCQIERCDISNWQMLTKADYTNFSIRF